MGRKCSLKAAFLLVLAFLLPTLSAHAENEGTGSGTPVITITLTNADTGSANANPGELTRVLARVVYEGCQEGSRYTLLFQMLDASTGSVCMFPDGSSLLNQPFTAERRAGVFEFEFDLDVTFYPGATLQESHALAGLELASVSGEEGRGCIYVPSLETDAVSTSGGKTVTAGNRTVICDAISYSGFAPGEQVRLVTCLKDADTDDLVCDENGIPISSVSTFTPTDTKGQIATKITADLTRYGDRNIALYEEVYIIQESGESFLLMTDRYDDLPNQTVYARLTEIRVLDEIYQTPVSGVGLIVTSQEDGSTYTGTSDENGCCRLPLNGEEENTCTLLSVPEKYQPADAPIAFTTGSPEGDCPFVISLLKKNTIVITRTDSTTGEPIPDLVTEVHAESGTILARLTSDAEGKIRFDADSLWEEAAQAAKQAGESHFVLNLVFQDTATPSSYFPRQESWTVSIDENGIITGQRDLSSVRREEIHLSMVDGNGTGIPGVTVSILDSNGALQGKATTDYRGEITFLPRQTGEYIIVTESVPAGYVRSLWNNRLTVEEDGKVSGSQTVTLLSENFTDSVQFIVIVTVLGLDLWLLVRLLVKKTIGKRLEPLRLQLRNITRGKKH